jgi:hypothetical protein
MKGSLMQFYHPIRSFAVIMAILAALFLFTPFAAAVPNDSALVDGDYTGDLVIYFDSGGTHYVGLQSSAVVYIEPTNANFVAAHASAGATKIRHRHTRYEYGAGPATPHWGAGGGLPGWPTMANGKDFWNWAYAGVSDGAGGDPSTQGNCVTYLFSTQCQFWVDSGGDDAPLWAALGTCVHGGAGCAEAAGGAGVFINDGDKAGNAEHVWLLENPKDGNGNGAAQRIRWKNNISGVYVWSRTGMAKPDFNCAPELRVSGGADVVAGKLITRTGHANPLYPNFFIKR